MSRSFLVAAVCAATLAACTSSAPRLHRPDRVEAFCGDRAAIPTAIESIVSSTSDKIGEEPVPSAAAVRKTVSTGGGIIAHWNAQPLYLPEIAKAVGASDGYVTLGDAAIGNHPGADYRPIYLTVRVPPGNRTFALRAYDVQDVCNEGKLSS